MKKRTSILWGLALIGIGAVFALNTLGITEIDIFFEGWWTLFIIIPSIVGLFTERDKTGNLIGIFLGVFLLLCAREILDFEMIWKLFLPVMAVILGLKLVFSGLFSKKKEKAPVEVNINVSGGSSNTAAFSGSELNYAGQEFTGTELTAVCGGIDCDLRGAIIEHDCNINITAVFGGIDLYMPDNVNVKTNVTCLFGGVDNAFSAPSGGPTVYIEGVCLFGGVDIH